MLSSEAVTRASGVGFGMAKRLRVWSASEVVPIAAVARELERECIVGLVNPETAGTWAPADVDEASSLTDWKASRIWDMEEL